MWQVHLDQPHDPRWWDTLSAPERERASRFGRPTQRRRFTVAHAAMRAILARACRIPAEELEFRTEPGGRPYLAQPGEPPPPDFNLSHSGEWALIAVAPQPWRVGIDIEQIRPDLDWLAMAGRMYQPAELDCLASATPELSRTEYFLLWSAKEAYIKAMGTGLSALRDTQVRRRPHTAHGTVLSSSAPATVWPVRWLDIAPGYTAALVTAPNTSQWSGLGL